MAAISKVIILYFDDFSGNNSFKAIKAKYQEKGIDCHGIKVSNNLSTGQNINANDIQWPEDLSIDENTRVLIIGHSRPGAEYFSSDDRKKLYPSEIAKVFKSHILPSMPIMRIRLIACCAARGSGDTPLIDAHLFDTIAQDSLANQLSLELQKNDLETKISCNEQIIIIADDGTYSTITIPMYTQENWSSRDYQLLQNSSYPEEEKELKSTQYEMLGRLMHGEMELKRPRSKLKIERTKETSTSSYDRYDHFTHFMEPYLAVQEKWKEKALAHNRKYKEIMREKCNAVKEKHHIKPSEIDGEFIELEEEITRRMFASDPGIFAVKIEEAQKEIESKIILLEDELIRLRSGAIKKKSNISFESAEFDDFFSFDTPPQKKQPSNAEKIKELELLLKKAKKTLPILKDLKEEILKESHSYTEKADKEWHEFIEALHASSKECLGNYHENKNIVLLTLEIEESLSEKMQQSFGNPAFFIDAKQPIHQIKKSLESIRKSADTPEEKVEKLKQLVAENSDLLQRFSDKIEALAKSKGASPPSMGL